MIALSALLAGGKALAGRNGLLLAVIAGLVTFYFLADRSGAARGRAEATIEQGKQDDAITATVAETRRLAADPRARGVLDPYVRAAEAQDEGGGGQL